MSWRSELGTCPSRTSTSSPQATSSSFCLTSCSHNTLAGTLKYTQQRTITHLEHFPCFFLSFLSTQKSAVWCHNGVISITFTCLIFSVLIILSSVLSVFVSFYLLLPHLGFPWGIIQVLSYLISSNLIRSDSSTAASTISFCLFLRLGSVISPRFASGPGWTGVRSMALWTELLWAFMTVCGRSWREPPTVLWWLGFTSRRYPPPRLRSMNALTLSWLTVILFIMSYQLTSFRI